MICFHWIHFSLCVVSLKRCLRRSSSPNIVSLCHSRLTLRKHISCLCLWYHTNDVLLLIERVLHFDCIFNTHPPIFLQFIFLHNSLPPIALSYSLMQFITFFPTLSVLISQSLMHTHTLTHTGCRRAPHTHPCASTHGHSHTHACTHAHTLCSR